MRKIAFCLSVLSFFGLIACGPDQPIQQAPREDPQLTAIKSEIAKTTPEGKEIIQKVMGLKPVVNDRVSGTTLGEIANDFANNKGPYNINVIGWEAEKKSSGRWKVIFHYQDYQKQYLAAEWEYNPETNSVYPFDFKNSPQFWTAPTEAESPKPSGRKKK